jgi:phage-related minor tail protein
VQIWVVLYLVFGFANGGAVSKGKPIVVGERGAELFIPNQSGQITQSARGTGGGQQQLILISIH